MLFHKHKERKIAAERHTHTAAELRERVDRITGPDGVIGLDGFKAFVEFVGAQDIDLLSFPELRNEVLLGLAHGGVFLPSEQTTLILKKDESSLLDTPVRLLKEIRDREFRGGSQGLSIPIGGGARYRVGAMRGRMVTVGSHWETADQGTLTITDQRAIYHGGRKTLEFAFGKLATLNVYSDAISLGVTNRQTTSVFGTSNAPLIAGIIHEAIDHQDDLKILTIQYQD